MAAHTCKTTTTIQKQRFKVTTNLLFCHYSFAFSGTSRERDHAVCSLPCRSLLLSTTVLGLVCSAGWISGWFLLPPNGCIMFPMSVLSVSDSGLL